MEKACFRDPIRRHCLVDGPQSMQDLPDHIGWLAAMEDRWTLKKPDLLP